MTESQQGRSVLITGVGKPGQLGAALVQAFADRGDTVYATGRTLPDVEALVAEVRQKGGKAHAFAADLANETEVEKLMAGVGALSDGRLDVLIHAAGKFVPFGPVADGSLDAWQQTFANNATSAFLMTRGVLPMLRAAHGAIVYIASAVGAGEVSPAGMADYAVAKAGLVQLVRAVAEEEQGTVRANVIAPGGIKTAEMVAAMGESPWMVSREDLAAKAIYLSGAESGDTTGTVVQM